MVRNAIWVSVAALLCLPAFSSTTGSFRIAAAEGKPAAKPGFSHVVIFYLTKDAPKEEADALIADCHEMLAKISTVRDLKAGKPSDKGTPMVSRTDYHVGLLVLFDDADGMKSYLDDKLHQDFINKHGKYLDRDKLIVVDFQDQAK
ncbi:MAG TPA: Dabb family protein [Gemmataceae bacterium]|jgi:hypothetical protein